MTSNQKQPDSSIPNKKEDNLIPIKKPTYLQDKSLDRSWIILTSLALMIVGLWLKIPLVGFSGALVALLLGARVIFPLFWSWLAKLLTPEDGKIVIAFLGLVVGIAVLAKYLGIYRSASNWLNKFKYDEFGSWAEWIGAIGQISIAILAVYVAWQQYVISRDLTIQQNRITQQQTIDTYFQGISDLMLNDEGLLEDWPQERAIAEGRTAAILSSVDGAGKAKILRFLSQSKLLAPLKRDRRLGRTIFDGSGGYLEDRDHGVRVIDLGVMLAGVDLSGTDLRGTDLSDANLVRTNLSNCDLVQVNLSRAILTSANLAGADLKGTRLFFGTLETASPRSRIQSPNYQTGAHTGAVIENANLTGVKRMSEEQRYYCCYWGGERTRATIPGGCREIANKLAR